MKHIINKITLLSLFLSSLCVVQAQETAESDSAASVTSEDLVQLAHRKVTKEQAMGSVSVVDVEELTSKSYNTWSLENMDALAPGWNGTSMWGMDANNGVGYLVLIDGVPRDADSIMPSEIESITFMKGASAVVLYGSSAAKGVVYITSKRGKEEDLKISATVNTGFHFTKTRPTYLGSAEYMTLYNEALENDGLSAIYSEEEIYNYGSGTNPYRYPNVDLYSSDYLTKSYNRTDASIQVEGGTKSARYYTNIGYIREGDMIDFGEAKKSGSNRLNIRGNVDFDISKRITAYVNAVAVLYDNKSANGDYWAAANSFRPNRISPLIPISEINSSAMGATTAALDGNIIDGGYILGGSQIDQTNIIADYYAAGSSKAVSRQFQFDTGLNVDLSGVTPGLNFGGTFAVDYSTYYTTSYNDTYSVYEPTWSNMNGVDEIVGLTMYGQDTHSGVQNISNSYERQTVAATAKLTYNRTFDKLHNVSGMLLANAYQQTITQQYHHPSNANLGLQAAYNYDGKYFADFAGALVHSSKFAEGNRSAFSPSLMLGWNLAREKFLSGTFVDDLRVSVSASILNTDTGTSDYYLYQDRYTDTEDVYYSWADGSGTKVSYSLMGANPDLTFTKRKEVSVNVAGALWDNRINFDVSYFTGATTGGITAMSNIYPNYFSSYYPVSTFTTYMNYNDDARSGFDFAVNYNTSLAKTELSFGVVGSYYRTEAKRRDEVYNEDYQALVGKSSDTIWGLQSDGFFESEEDIKNSPEHTFGTVSPGDIKYVDQNNDGVINDYDQIALGEWGSNGSPLSLGVNVTAKWRNFTIFALATAKFGSEGMKNSSYYWISGDMKYSEVVRGRWTEETAATATYPRLTTSSSDNNFRSSDFWLYKNNRFDLAKLQLTYDLPAKIFKKSAISGLSTYVGAYNLITISKERECMEVNVYGAPATRFVNFGVKATF